MFTSDAESLISDIKQVKLLISKRTQQHIPIKEILIIQATTSYKNRHGDMIL